MAKDVNDVMVKTTFAALNIGQRYFRRDHTGETNPDPYVLRKDDVDTYRITGLNGNRDFHQVQDPNMEVWVDTEEF